MKHWLQGLLTLGLLVGCATPNPNPRASQPLQPAAQVDLQRYMGTWYVIANIPYFAESGKVAAHVEYSLRPDGRINDWYFARDHEFSQPLKKTEGVATVADAASNARWSVQFVWPISADYVILYVDPDYRYAVVGHPSRNYAWIFSREVRMSDERYTHLLDLLQAQGYDSTRLRRVLQVEDQLGAPGYQ